MVGRQSPLNTSPPTHALVGGLTNGISTSPHSTVAVVNALRAMRGSCVLSAYSRYTGSAMSVIVNAAGSTKWMTECIRRRGGAPDWAQTASARGGSAAVRMPRTELLLGVIGKATPTSM